MISVETRAIMDKLTVTLFLGLHLLLPIAASALHNNTKTHP